MSNPWLALVKVKHAEVKKEGRLKGSAGLREAIQRAKKVYKGKGAMVRSKGQGKGQMRGMGQGPIGTPKK
ncbi:hypothetical protein KAW50_02555 [candidate division WOR-3 bacterium]|nr:hypothetical protein [candidate division WOR-3 bacterium]